MKILFITWDGPQVNYLESLFLPIFKRLTVLGYDFHIIQFTWGSSNKVEATRKACIEAGFTYQAKFIWRNPVSFGSFFTALSSVSFLRNIVKTHHIDMLMPRSTLPALMAVHLKKRTGLPMIFDADGLPLDERVDFGGQSPSSLAARFLRDAEAQAVLHSELILTRSQKAIEILTARGGAGVNPSKFHVVGNGRDTSLFTPGSHEERVATRLNLGLSETAPVLIYAGSIGPQYCVLEMFELFSLVLDQRNDAHLIILTGDPASLSSLLTKYPKVKIASTVKSVPGHAVPEYLACADVGLALRRPSFSMVGVAPIKLGEYLLCGLPVVASTGIGDDNVLSADVVFPLPGFSREDLIQSAMWILEKVLTCRDDYRSQSREIGEKQFSLESSAESYSAALGQLKL